MTYFPTYISKKAFWETVSSTKRFFVFLSLRDEDSNGGSVSSAIKEPCNDSLFNKELDLFKKFSTSDNYYNDQYNQENQIPCSKLDFDINFDHPSLEFEVTLQNMLPDCSEIDILSENMEIGESWINRHNIQSKCRGIMDKIMTFIRTTPSSKQDMCENYNYIEESPITTMKVPINEEIGVSRALDISIFTDDGIDDSHSTIKFSQFADILVYNKNCDEKKSISNFRSVKTLRSSNKYYKNKPKHDCIHSILKNKVNHNFSEELSNTKITDSINLNSFLSNFESFENEKFHNATGLNEKRLQQLKNYYSNKLN